MCDIELLQTSAQEACYMNCVNHHLEHVTVALVKGF